MKAANLLAALFEKYQPEMRRLIAHKFNKTHHEAEDIVQDAFHNILRAENIESLENPKAYLYQTASNLALNRIRKQKHNANYINELDAEATDELTPERYVSADRDLKRLEQALVRHPQKYRHTFLLCRVHEKTYREISEMLNISESTVEKNIIKTLKYLRDQLGVGVEL